jgi:hypothetical protein
LTVTGNAIITGDLTVSGTTTTINTETILLADNIITLNSNFTTGTPTENAGIEVRRGSSSTVSFYWDESTDRWTADNTLSVSGNVVLTGTIDTGQGATEVYLMNQNVRTTDDVTFNDLTLNGGDLSLSNGTSNRIIYNTSGVAQPSFTNRSAGTKIVLYPNIGASSVDYAFGIEGSTLWSSVPTTSERFLWYGGISTAMQLQGSGNLTLAGNLSALQVDTGQGLTEVHLMNQNIRTSDSPTFTNLTLTGQFNIPNNALISVNSEPDTWGARFRTTTSTTNLGAQLKNIIWTGGGANEGFAVSGVGTGGAALEVRNDGIVWAKSSVYSNAAGNGGAFYLSDTAAGIYRDNTYDVTVIQNNSSGNILNLASAGDVRVSIDSNNNDTGVRFIVGNNAIKSTNELFSVNESGIAYASSDFRAPIFYDSDNTSYYTNQLSISRYNLLQVNKTYQNEQFIDVPGTFNGDRRWVRFSISRFNSGGSPVRLSISRAITDNGSNPYGGCTAEFVINSREWHSGQENMWYFYTEHGTYNANQNPYAYYIYQAGPRDLAGGGYWFYMLLLDGVRYRMSVSADMNFNNDNIGSIEYSVADPGGVPRVPLGSGVIGNNTTYNQTTSTYAMHGIMYDYDDRNYYIDPNSTSRIRKTNLVASGTGWDDGLNLYSSDESNRWNLLVDNGASDYLRFAYNNAEDFRLQPDATISYNSMYAPIYYDLDDSTYYTNPANGGFVLQGGSSNRVKFYTNDSGFRVQNAEGNGVSDVRLGAAWGAPGVYSSTYLMLGAESYVEFRIGNSQKGYMDSSSNLYSFGSVRSPIYYDYTSTAYYLDPASTSNLNEVYAYSYRGNGNVGGTGNASWHPNGIYSAGYNWLYGGINGGGNSATNFSDVRASIFYDYDDTGYFLNPASTATSLRIQGGIKQRNLVGRPYAVWGAGGGATGAVIIKFPGGSGNYGMIHAVIDIYEYNGNAAATVIVGGHNWNGAWYNYNCNVVGYTDKPVRVGFKDGRYCIVIGNGSSSWSYGQVVLRKIQNGAYYDGVMDVAEGYSANIESDSYSWISGDLQVLRSRNIYGVDYVQAPIFYDTNSTYFGDFSSEIRMPYYNGGTMRFRTNTHWDSISGIDLIGAAGEFRMSSDSGNLNLRVDGWIIGYDYLQSLGAVYGTIYYDQNNTGYYVNPDSYSNMNEGNFAGRMWYSNYLVSRNSGGMMGDYNVNGTSSKVIWTIGESWPIGNMYGLGYEYGSGYDHHLALRNNGTTYSRFGFAGGAFIGGTVSIGGAMYAPIYYDSNDAGYYGDFASTSRTNYIVGNRIKLVNNVNNEPRWDFSAYVVEAQHWYGNNSSMTMYMGEASNTIQVPGSGGIRPQVVYDYNNAGYYLDMDGTSNLYAVTNYTRQGAMALGRMLTNRRDITSDQNHWTGTWGWGTSYGTWASAWEGGFSAWDIWGGGTDHPQGGGYVHAQGIVSGQHYATGGGGTAYGWMMVGAHDADSRWWLRGKWGGTTRAWYEIVLYGRNVGGGDIYAGYWYDGNNTGYYIDPNGSSQMSAVYSDNWFRPQGCTGLLFNSWGRGIWSPECEGNPYGHIATYGGGRNGWGGYGIFSRYTLMSTGGDNMGMHDTARGWIWYMEGGRLQMHWAGNRRMVTESHGVYFDADARASIFYDHDTSFYFDGNGTTRWQGLDDYSKMRIGLTARGNFRRNDYTGNSDYWVGTMGWGNTDLISAFNWGSGFIDTWGSPSNQPPGESHWVGIQASHYNAGYNTGYGIQIVGGPIQGLWHTSYWSSKRSWYKIAMYGLNEYSNEFWSTIVYDSNNSGFYSDPNGTSALSRVTVDAEIISRNGCGRIYLPGNLHIDSYCGYSIYMNYYTNQWLRIFGPSEYYGNGIYGVGEIYSNIFYDRNDSSYRLDPNGTSQLHYVLANNWFRPQGCTGVYWESYGRGIWSPECEGNPYGHIATYGGGRNGWYGYGVGSRYTLMSTLGDNIGMHDSARGWIWYMSGAELNMYYAGSRRMVTTSWGVYVDQYLEAGGSLRAPIFYDNQDTGYYLDQHNTDNQGLRMRGGTLHGPNWYWGAYLRVGTNERVDSWASMFTSSGNLHIDSRNGYPMYLNWHNGNTVYVENDMQAQIYYDRNDTGYYFGSSSGDGRFRYTNTNGGYSQPNYEFQFVTNRAYYVNDTNTANLQAFSNSNLTAFFSWHKTGVFATNMGLDVDNVIRIGGWSMGANRWQLTPGGDMYAAGNIIAYSSDERLKENITTISDALGMLKRLRGVYFDWKDMVDDLGFNPVDRHDIGVIAQEVEKVIPQAIKPAPFDALSDGKSISGQNYKTVQLEKIVPVLIQSVKEQQEIIENQNKEIEELKTIVYKILNKN